MDDFKAFVDRVKDANNICDVMGELGSEYRMGTRVVSGWYYGAEHQSLAANPTICQYFWGSHSPVQGQRVYTHGREQGDIFQFLHEYKGMDFQQALEWLALRANLAMPQYHKRNEQEQQQANQREQLLDLAMDWFERRLWESPAALAYARGRGWSDETIHSKTENGKGEVVARGAALGFSGGNAEAGDQLRDFVSLKGCDVTSPEAVALFGLRGNVKGWCEAHSIQPVGRWLDNDRIYGITDFPRLIYPVRKYGQGQALYFYGRNLTWEGKTLRAVKKGETAPRMHNIQKQLMGEPPLYLNYVFSKTAKRIVLVEGAGDAVSLGQCGIAAIALNGLGAHQELRWLLCNDKNNAVQAGRVFCGLDADGPGQEAVEVLGDFLGGTLRIVDWQKAKGLL